VGTDYYQKWLGIPRAEQPPNHYRILGLAPFEADSDRIISAANHIAAAIQRRRPEDDEAADAILYEVALARACLQNPRTREPYDQQLRELMASRAAGAAKHAMAGGPEVTPPPADFGEPEFPETNFSVPEQSYEPFRGAPLQSRKKKKSTAGPTAVGLIGSAIISFISFVATVYWVMPALTAKPLQPVPQPTAPAPKQIQSDNPLPRPRQPRPPRVEPKSEPITRNETKAITAPQPSQNLPEPKPVEPPAPFVVAPPAPVAIKPVLPPNWIIELPSGDFLDEARLQDAKAFDMEAMKNLGDALFVSTDPNSGLTAAFVYDEGKLSGPAMMVIRDQKIRVKSHFDGGMRTGVLVIFDDANNYMLISRYGRGPKLRGTFLLKNGEPVLAQDWKTNGEYVEFLISGDELAPKASLSDDEEAVRVTYHDRLESLERSLESSERLWRLAASRWLKKQNLDISKIIRNSKKPDELKRSLQKYRDKARDEANAQLDKMADLFLKR